MMDLEERAVRYLLKVECECCGDYVYPHEDYAREEVKHWIEYEDARDIEDIKARLSRTCDHCEHMLTKDD